MSNFTIQSKSVTVTRYLIELDEAQARAILVDATEFQKQLRIALAQRHAPDAPSITLDDRRNGHRRPKVKRVKVDRDRKPIARVPCENCGVLIAAYRQGKHKCRSAALAAKS
jgi:hypothetical protein